MANWWDCSGGLGNCIPTGSAGPGWENAPTVFGTLQDRWIGEAWVGIAMSAVLASFFMVAIAWMLASAFNHQGLKKWVRGEIYHVLANFLLVIGLVAMVGIVLTNVTEITANMATATGGFEYAGSGGATIDNPFVLAEIFLDENIQCQRMIYLDAYMADSFIEPIEHFSIGIGGMDAVSAGNALTPITSALYLMAHNTSFLLLANYLQRHLLIFIFQTMFTLFLPVGIILRTLPVTRGLGGFMIALAIGLYIVYPISYSAMLLTSRQMSVTSTACTLSINAADAAGIHSSDLTSFMQHRSLAERLLPTIHDKIALYSSLYPFMVFRSFLFPLVAITLVFTFVRATAGFFGADIAEVGRGLIKLI
ncbi:MAG: hypothetical protein Q7T16_03390 [Candidatus Burarchaeum sp.]|nr:hypothetical protein [Candidatus Burarchaeum sp.]MDO8339676.1 hypothetical protein [Candidatus Burarchaeum sp.]